MNTYECYLGISHNLQHIYLFFTDVIIYSVGTDVPSRRRIILYYIVSRGDEIGTSE